VRLNPFGTAASITLVFQPQMIDDGDFVAAERMKIGRGNQSTRRKPAPDPGSKPGRRSGKPATNRMSYGTAQDSYLFEPLERERVLSTPGPCWH
jgi:hypothetical protein